MIYNIVVKKQKKDSKETIYSYLILYFTDYIKIEFYRFYINLACTVNKL